MQRVRSVVWAARLASVAFVFVLACFFGPGKAQAANEPASHTAPAATPAAAKLNTLLELLADPDVKATLAGARRGTETALPAAAPPGTMAASLGDRLQGLRAHLLAVSANLPGLSNEADGARLMVADAVDGRGWSVAGFFATFVALGFGAEWLFRRAVRPRQAWLLGLTLETVSERVRAAFMRLVYGLAMVVCFALGSVGAFLLFDWPGVIKDILLGYLIAFLAVRLIAVLGRILLAPGAPRFRVVPISTEGAIFLFRRWIAAAILIGFGWQTLGIFGRFGLSPLSSELCADVIAFVAMLLGFDIVWRAPPMALADEVEIRGFHFAAPHRRTLAALSSILLVVLWVLWIMQARRTFWLAAFAFTLPGILMVARRSINHVLRPIGSSLSAGDANTLDVIVFERGIRGLLIVGAALLLGRILDVDFVSLTMQDTVATRLVRAGISIVVIVLAADFFWNVSKALIDRKLASNLQRIDTAEDAAHAARLQTLLPIFRNILFVTIALVAGMMALASAGVEIGPLIASAGVVGVAIGFGAQTLVKDIISGIFYLVDDAFRIGEYIQSGTYKGTVESFSLRSIKLRHQRGALYTVPFGILGAVQNQSRDWVVDKIVMNVRYDTDLEKVRKIVKRIGETLAADEEIGPEIINPLKMQGVVQFGDFAIQIQTKMMTKPGDVQFLARRRALLMINQAFAENGIGFAVPTVQVSGESGGAAAAAGAAQKGFELLRRVQAE